MRLDDDVWVVPRAASMVLGALSGERWSSVEQLRAALGAALNEQALRTRLGMLVKQGLVRLRET